MLTPKTDKFEAVGHLPSGLYVVCCKDEKSGRVDGYLASWIQQISFNPLLLSLAIKPGRPAYDGIIKKNVFTINIIGDHNDSYMKDFWSGYHPENNPFSKLELMRGEQGGVIIKEAKSAIEAKLLSKIKPGDHDIIIAEVLSSYVLNEKAAPLIHIRKTGSNY